MLQGLPDVCDLQLPDLELIELLLRGRPGAAIQRRGELVVLV